MEFTRNFPASYSWTDISKTIRNLVEECDAKVSVEAIGKLTTIRIDVDNDDLRGFLHCAANYVDDHTLSSWEHQVEVAEARSEIQHEYGRATGRILKEKWVKIKKGVITDIKKPTKAEIEKLLDEGYTITRHTEREEDGITKTELFSYSPLSREEAIKHEQAMFLQEDGRATGKSVYTVKPLIAKLDALANRQGILSVDAKKETEAEYHQGQATAYRHSAELVNRFLGFA